MSFYGVTFSGIDESVQAAQLLEVRSHYFPVEWGVRFGEEHPKEEASTSRLDWISTLAQVPNLSAHLEGRLARDFLAAEDTELITRYGEVLPIFRRIQVPYLPGKIDWRGMGALAKKYGDKKVTIEVSLECPDLDAIQPPFSLLFNRGESGTQWPKARKGLAGSGYSGGLAPDNLSKQLSLLTSVARPAGYWWIDLNTSLRVIENGKDCFSCETCKKAIRAIEGYFMDYVI